LISLGLDEHPAPGPQPEPEPDRQLPLFQQPPSGQTAQESQPAPPGTFDATPHFLLETDEKRRALTSGETFLVSFVIHVAAILFLATHPELINLGSSPRIVVVKPEEKLTMLYEPPPERPKLPAPPVKPMTLPRMAGSPDSQLERPAPPPPNRLIEPPQGRPQPAKPPGSPDNQDELMARKLEPIGIPNFPDASKVPPKAQPSLENLPKPKEAPAPTEAQLRLPNLAPASRGTDAILREMAKQHAEGGGKGMGGAGTIAPDTSNPNFNLPGPQILSDTMGVDFDPYLLRVYLIVQRNWYSVIPEIARLGRKGRAVLQFTIRKDGSVEGLQMMDGSGTGSMDSAALSSIRLSNPFPPLPAEFPGNNILLRFGYYYNMQPEY